ncbi:MAG: tRNA lysidine(34) synthetase TilS [Candidatus Nitrosocaldaceae archaeon]|nr:MAG: tRNA lysidine(34) synthetase TilS [Candidatus Nitrosocaldaceae archaeon]
MQCDRCLDTAVYKRVYSGEKLCKNCFSRSIRAKVAKTISKYSMIKHNDTVAIGVSGGKDSLALLHILKPLCKEHGNRLIAITIDEGIKDYRDESLSIVKEFTEELGIEHHIFSYKELFGNTLDDLLIIRDDKNLKLSSCSICGTFRRRALDLAALSVKANVLATAHNLDDFIQTFFMNIFAGDIDRIGFMNPEPLTYAKDLRKIKPLMAIYENEIAFYAIINDIPFQEEQCPHMSESIRNSVRSFLNNLEKEHAGIKYNTFRSILKVSNHIKNNNKHNKCKICNMDSSMDICSACKMKQLLM